MLIYLLSLPIWNFVLPVYGTIMPPLTFKKQMALLTFHLGCLLRFTCPAFWHFDDFSWGQTRKVDGEKKDAGHASEGGEFDPTKIPHRNLLEWISEAQEDQIEPTNPALTFFNQVQKSPIISKPKPSYPGQNP
jgi:chitin synthase